MAPIEIHGMPASAPCRIATMTAEVLGLEYNYKVVDLAKGDNKTPEYLALNPMHNIPTVVDGDLVMNESRAIAAYLANKYSKDDKLYPTKPEVRAKVDQRLYFDMGTFYPALADCMYPIMFGGPMPGDDKFEKLKEVLGWVEGFVADNKFAAGTDWMTIGDISLLATYSTLKEAGLGDLQNFPNMKTWFEKCCKLIPNYQVANGNGAEEFGTYYKTAGKR